MRLPHFLLAIPCSLLVLASCGGDKEDDDVGETVALEGSWTGDCVLQADGYDVEIGLAMTLSPSADTAGPPYSGPATAVYSGEDWEGSAAASQTGVEADATVDLTFEDFDIQVLLDGTLSTTGATRAWDGACSLGAGNGTFALTRG